MGKTNLKSKEIDKGQGSRYWNNAHTYKGVIPSGVKRADVNLAIQIMDGDSGWIQGQLSGRNGGKWTAFARVGSQGGSAKVSKWQFIFSDSQ